MRPIDREENIGTYLLRAKQLGLSWFELFELRQGEVVDMMIEKENDSAQYDYIATQDDMDHVFD
ncbi:MAG: hypothetical protein IKY16_02480 [Bacteroidales bacterium]|nr:hypothetical protein [Bacteroidales bacterium]